MNVNRKTLILAIAAGMGMVPIAGVWAGPLNASSTTGVLDGKPVYMPLEVKENTTSYYSNYTSTVTGTGTQVNKVGDGGDLDTYIYTKPGYPVGANSPLSVRVTLTGGAKFVVAPTLLCPHSAGTTTNKISTEGGISAALWSNITVASTTDVTANFIVAGYTAYKITPSVLTPNLSGYSFTFPAGFNVAQGGSGACLLTFTASTAYDATNVGTTAFAAIKAGAVGQPVEMNVEVNYQQSFETKKDTAKITMISFVTAYKAEFSTVNVRDLAANDSRTAAAATVDVSKLSKQFITSGANSTVALAGHIIVTAVDPTRVIRAANGKSITASQIIDSASIVVTGPSIASLSKVTFHQPKDKSCASTPLLQGSPAVVSTSGGANGSVTVQVVGGVAGHGQVYSGLIGLLPDGSSPASQAHSGFAVCLVADGVKVMSEGQVTVTINGLTPAGAALEIGSGDLVKVTRNGTAIRVLNVPPKGDAYQTSIRLYNTSTQDVDVSGTLYGPDGKTIADGLTLVKGLKPNNVFVVSSAYMVDTLMAGKNWTGRAWLLIQAPVSSDLFKVQALMRSPSGVLTNFSAEALD